MFSGKKFRLWSRRSSSSKKDTEREPDKDKRRISQQKTDNENLPSNTCPLTNLDKTQSQLILKLREENLRLEDVVKDLTPYKLQSASLEKKLITTTKSIERKELRFTAAISSLEHENENLREEIKRIRSTCAGCYFCSRPPEQFQNNQEAFTSKLHSIPNAAKDLRARNDEGSNESMQSSESWRRLERLEEEQSAILKETSRQKQETSRCLQQNEQISNELTKALISQKSLRRDCSQLQDRISQLEKQNEHLNRVLFRQFTPSSSSSSSLQTRHPTIKRNEFPNRQSEFAQKVSWEEPPSQNICSADVQNVEENATLKVFCTPFVPPYRNRLSRDIYRTTQVHPSKDYIPEVVRENNVTSIGYTPTDEEGRAHGGAGEPPDYLPNRNSLITGKSERDNYLKSEDKEDENNCNSETTSTSTLQDEIEEILRSATSRPYTSNQGSNFSLNDILDGDIDELRRSIQNLESTRHKNNSTRNLQRSAVEYFKEPAQVPDRYTSQSTNIGHSNQNNSLSRSHRYSYPVSSSVKRGVPSEKRIILSGNLDLLGEDEERIRDETEKLVPNKRNRLEAALLKIENVINNGSVKETGKTYEPSYLECPNLPREHPVAGHNREDTTSDDDDDDDNEVWNLAKKDRRLDSLLQDADQLPSDSTTDVSENSFIRALDEDVLDEDALDKDALDEDALDEDALDEDASDKDALDQDALDQDALDEDALDEDALDEDDCTSEEGKQMKETNPVKAKTTQEEREKISVTEDFQEEHLRPLESKDEEKQYEDAKDIQTVIETTESVNRNARKPDISEFGEDLNEMKKFGDKISVRRDSITDGNTSKDAGREITMSKDKVTALAAYFEEVHAEQCSDSQHSYPKPRSLSCTSKSSTDSKESSSFDDDDDDDYDDDASIIQSNTDEFQTIRHQRPNAKVADETNTCTPRVHELDAGNPMTRDFSKPDVNLSKAPQKNNSETNGKVPQSETQNVKVNSTQDFVPVDSKTDITALNYASKQTPTDETFSPQSTLEAPLCKLELLDGEMEIAEQDVRRSFEHTLEEEETNVPMVISVFPAYEQTQCNSLPSNVDGSAQLHVNYVRTCSLKSFWDVVTPPPSPKSQKQEEGKSFPGVELHEVQVNDQIQRNEATVDTDRPTETQSNGEDGIQGRVQSEGQLKKEIALTETEDRDDLTQTFLPFLLPSANQQSLENSYANKTHNFRNDIQTDDFQKILNVSKEKDFKESLANYARDNTDNTNNKTSCYHHPEFEHKKIESLSKSEFPGNRQQQLETSRRLPTETSPECGSCEPTVNELEHLLSRIHSYLPTLGTLNSRSDEEKETQPGTLTEKDIRKYQLGLPDYGTDTAGENHPLSPVNNHMQSPKEMDCFENPSQRGLSSKPPLPPRRFHATQYFVHDGSNSDQEIPDYEELQDDDDYNCHSAETSFHRTEFSADDIQRNSGLDSERYVFHAPKSDTHIPGSQSASTGFQFTFQKQPVRFRSYSKSWDGAKRNSYPAARFRSYSQPEEEWDNVPSTAYSAWRYPVDCGKNLRPVSAYQVPDASPVHGVRAKASPRSRIADAKWSGAEENQNSKDAENDLVFCEITKQIETLKQTVSELQNKKTDSNSRL